MSLATQGGQGLFLTLPLAYITHRPAQVYTLTVCLIFFFFSVSKALIFCGGVRGVDKI